jgi:hypothetical protein
MGAVKMAIAAASTGLASTGYGLPLAIIGYATLAIVELGTIIWEQWTEAANKKRHARYRRKVGTAER